MSSNLSRKRENYVFPYATDFKCDIWLNDICIMDLGTEGYISAKVSGISRFVKYLIRYVVQLMIRGGKYNNTCNLYCRGRIIGI